MRLAATIGVIFALAVFLTVAGSSRDRPAPASAAGAVQGDTTCNGTVDALDALQVVRFASGIDSSAGCLQALGNADCSAAIDIADAVIILRFAAGLPNSPTSGCQAVGDSSPSSEDLIDAALTAGTIDDETALLYRVYAAFQDDRLPDQYKGTDTGRTEPPDELFNQPPDLSPETQALLAPFIMPPADPDSWYDTSTLSQPVAFPNYTPPPGTWASVNAGSTKMRIWWDQRHPGDEARALAVAAEVVRLWDLYTTMFGSEPPVDSGIATYHGPDGLYDAYLAPLRNNVYGYVAPYVPGLTIDPGPCGPKPSFMVLNRGKNDTELKVTIAHELFHSFQFGVGALDSCEDIRWLMESTAVWAEDYAYPNLNSENEYLAFWDQLGWRMQEWGQHSYDAFVFFLYLTRTSSPAVMSAIWQATRTEHVFDAIDHNIAGGLKERWPEFALFGFNSAPLSKFQIWNSITRTVFVRPLHRVTEGAFSQWDFHPLDPMSVTYYVLSLRDDFQFVKITDVYESDSVALQVLYHGDDGWIAQTIAPHGTVELCSANADISKVMIIVSNSHPTDIVDLAGDEYGVEAAPFCNWQGTTSYTGSSHVETIQAVTDSTFSYTASNLSFEIDLDASDPEGIDGLAQLVYKLKEGFLQYDLQTVSTKTGHPTCTTTGSGSIILEAGDATLTLTEESGGLWKYVIEGDSTQAVTKTSSCGGPPLSQELGQWILSGEKTAAITTEIAGTDHVIVDDNTNNRVYHSETNATWNLHN